MTSKISFCLLLSALLQHNLNAMLLEQDQNSEESSVVKRLNEINDKKSGILRKIASRLSTAKGNCEEEENHDKENSVVKRLNEINRKKSGILRKIASRLSTAKGNCEEEENRDGKGDCNDEKWHHLLEKFFDCRCKKFNDRTSTFETINQFDTNISSSNSSESSDNTSQESPEIDNENANKFLCQWGSCTTKFTSANKFFEHVHLHIHKRKWQTKKYNKNYICKWSGCSRGGKCWNKYLFLNRHILVHTKQKPYQCERCDKRFNTPHGKKIHLEKEICIKTKNAKREFEFKREYKIKKTKRKGLHKTSC